jgi:hypothetical protein
MAAMVRPALADLEDVERRQDGGNGQQSDRGRADDQQRVEGAATVDPPDGFRGPGTLKTSTLGGEITARISRIDRRATAGA